MGRACKHENADHLKAGDFYDDAADACFGPYEAKCEQFRCLDCGAWLPLGPSRDTPEVCVEIRAAEIAADFPTLPNHTLDDDVGCARCGWSCLGPPHRKPGLESGHLARIIHDHGDPNDER